MARFVLISPLRLEGVYGNGKNKDKKFPINKNIERNTHFHVLNKAKVLYKDHMASQILALPMLNKVMFDYTIYFDSNRIVDYKNIGFLTDKWFCDALVQLGKWPDDNNKYDRGTTMLPGPVKPKAGYVEICINEIL